jgi:hypothetical protein
VNLRGAVAVGCMIFSASVLQANSLFWTGDTDSAFGGFTWNRPTVDSDPPTALAKVGGGQGYLAEEFSVDTTGTYSFSVVQNGSGSGNWDSVDGNILGFLYQNSFDPAAPLTNVLWSGGPPATSSWTYTLDAGTDYFIAITGYCGTGTGPGSGSVAACNGTSLEEGPFSATLSGPGIVTELGQSGDFTPEPATFILVLGALLLLGGRVFFQNSRPLSPLPSNLRKL